MWFKPFAAVFAAEPAAFVAAGLCDGFEAGIEIARDSIDSGKAREKLTRLIELTQQCKPYTRDEPMGL